MMRPVEVLDAWFLSAHKIKQCAEKKPSQGKCQSFDLISTAQEFMEW